MNALVKLGATFVVGMTLYGILFAFFIHRPLGIGITIDYLKEKRAIVQGIKDKKKILVLAGSNGRFSHRCETIENTIGIPCANVSIAAGYNLYFQLRHYLEFIRPGDLLYMPLEFRGNPRDYAWTVGSEGKIAVRYDHEYLREMGFKKAIASLFSFDIRFLVGGMGEMILHAAGKKRRVGIFSLTPQGDESGHDQTQSSSYRDLIRDHPTPIFDTDSFGNEQNWDDLLKVLTWARDHGVRVVGGLPTLFEEVNIPDQALQAHMQLFTRHGHCFLVLDNHSRYPRDLFFDTFYHLRQEGQIQHSIQVAKGLQKFLSRQPVTVQSSPGREGQKNSLICF